jgi:hypothetical protein
MYQGSTITTTRHFIFLCLTMAKLANFDTTISNSFLGQILVEDAEIHRKRQLWAPIKFVSHWQNAVADFCEGCLMLA